MEIFDNDDDSEWCFGFVELLQFVDNTKPRSGNIKTINICTDTDILLDNFFKGGFIDG